MVKKRQKRITRVEFLIIILSGNCCSSLPVLNPPRMFRQGARQEMTSDISPYTSKTKTRNRRRRKRRRKIFAGRRRGEKKK